TGSSARRSSAPWVAAIQRSMRRSRFGLVVPRVTVPTTGAPRPGRGRAGGNGAGRVVMPTRVGGYPTATAPTAPAAPNRHNGTQRRPWRPAAHGASTTPPAPRTHGAHGTDRARAHRASRPPATGPPPYAPPTRTVERQTVMIRQRPLPGRSPGNGSAPFRRCSPGGPHAPCSPCPQPEEDRHVSQYIGRLGRRSPAVPTRLRLHRRQPRRVAMLSVHTSPLHQPGTGDAGGMNVYIVELAQRLAAINIEV